MNIILERLKEREKELKCLYKIEELLKDDKSALKDVLNKIIQVIPQGWQYTTICEAKIRIDNTEAKTEDFRETEWCQHADIIIDSNVVGKIEVCYTQFIRLHNNSQFLPEEQKLLNSIADRLGNYLFYQKLKNTIKYLKSPPKELNNEKQKQILLPDSDEHWKWRLKIAETIASKIDAKKFGVKELYIIGSTKNATAGPSSDIDLLLHFKGNNSQKQELMAWINGWSLCLSEINYLKTGHKSEDGLIDLHIITDEDIKDKTSFACMINAVTDAARPLNLKK